MASTFRICRKNYSSITETTGQSNVTLLQSFRASTRIEPTSLVSAVIGAAFNEPERQGA